MSPRKIIGCFLAGTALTVVLGCHSKPPRTPQAKYPNDAGQKAMEKYDTNKDGKLSGAELGRCPALTAALAKIDTAGDGTITADKIDARIAKWVESKTASARVFFIVRRNGKPFRGAVVKLVPEPYLGNEVSEITGETADGGAAMVAGAPGFYRVEITKAGEKVPARYNTQTTLGQELALDAEGAGRPIAINLQY
jgi:hypothetical protein